MSSSVTLRAILWAEKRMVMMMRRKKSDERKLIKQKQTFQITSSSIYVFLVFNAFYCCLLFQLHQYYCRFSCFLFCTLPSLLPLSVALFFIPSQCSLFSNHSLSPLSFHLYLPIRFSLHFTLNYYFFLSFMSFYHLPSIFSPPFSFPLTPSLIFPFSTCPLPCLTCSRNRRTSARGRRR